MPMFVPAVAQAASNPAGFRAALGITAGSYTVVGRQRPTLDKLNYVTIASGSNTANSRQSFYAAGGADLTDIILGFPGFYEGNPETDLPASITVVAAIEYPVGTFTRVYFRGATSLAIAPGRIVYTSDPVPIFIPRGAQFWVKHFWSWTGGVVDWPLASFGVNSVVGEWCSVGTGLTDKTTTTTAQTSSYTYPTNSLGFSCAVYARKSAVLPVLGIIGDSISQGTGDMEDQNYGGRSIERSFRGAVSVVNVSRQSETLASYVARPDGRSLLLRDSITHLLLAMGRNDLTAGSSAASIQDLLQKALNPWLARGVKVFATTLMPCTTSSDGWITTANQAQNANAHESDRILYNAWLRSNWRNIGLTGLLDYARVVDPTDSGKWAVDGTSGGASLGVAALTGGAVSSVGLPTYMSGVAYAGTAGYPINQSALPCVVSRYPDDTGSVGAVVTCATNGSGVVTSYSVVSGGSYSIPPLVVPSGPWTADGLHPTRRGYDAIIAACGFGPNRLMI